MHGFELMMAATERREAEAERRDELDRIEARMAEIDGMDENKMETADLARINQEYEKLGEKRKALVTEFKADKAKRDEILKRVSNGEGTVLERSPEQRGKHMDFETNDNKTFEMRAFQKYITEGARNMTENEYRSLNLAGSAAVLPTTIANTLIHSEKFSDLLYRANVVNQGGAGVLRIPIASNNAATWHVENAAGTEASPTLTYLDLSGYELVRLTQISAATASMAAPDFERYLTELLAAEVIETLEDAFVSGTGIGQALGLDNMVWNAGNQVLTLNNVTPIAPSHIAAAMALMPSKYLRGAVLMMNPGMMMKMAQFTGTAEYIFDATLGATKFLGHDIIMNAHVGNDVIYIVQPRELHVRFADPITVKVDHSVGFTTNSVWIKAACVVDALWNPAACVRVGLGA